MKTPYYILFIALVLMIVSGCEDDNGSNNNTIDGTGPVISQNIDLQSFDGIELTGVADFYITIGTPQSVVLKAQQNIIDVMTWNVNNSSLEVGLKNNVSIGEHDGIQFDITVPSVTDIVLEGVGDFVLSGEEQSDLNITMTGVGNIRAYGMKVNNCSIILTGVGSSQVFVNNNLAIQITGVGSVYYKGDPALSLNITGLGQVINANQPPK